MLAALIVTLCTSEPISFPKLFDDRLELTLIAREPDIVTPTGVAVDARGRVFVVECHTHFRPKDYPGPEKDRILLFDQISPDGKSPPPKVFFEGTEATMNIGISPEGDLFIATRQEISVVRDIDSLDRAFNPIRIAHLDTKGDYPHNGLSGFAFDHSGNLWLGLGENLGADYSLIAADGSSCRGGGEGGSIFTLRTDGSKLRRVATGFWNPFHLYRDPGGLLFAVDNDPDARPPCRLLHIIDGGDYGFKFRYGRNGIHPFHAWNGELPGTLPMVAGTGEAPSGMVGIEGAGWPKELLGQLIVTSWGDNRLERFQLQPFGTSFRSTIEPILVGDDMFRPVGIAIGKPGELYFSDWVDKSYELHRKGRLWRLRTKRDLPTVTQEEITRFETSRPRESALPDSTEATLSMLADSDPFTRTRARRSLRQTLSTSDITSHFQKTQGPTKVEWLLILRDQNPTGIDDLIRATLRDQDASVRLVAIQWIGDKNLQMFRPDVEQILSQPFSWTRPLFESTLASLDLLDKRWARADAGSQFIARLLDRNDLDPVLYRYALRSLPANNPWLTADRFRKLVNNSDPALAIEAVRSLRESSLPERDALITDFAGNTDLPPTTRAEAILGLQTLVSDNTLGVLLVDLSQESDPLVSSTATRVIQRGSAPLRQERTMEAVRSLLDPKGDRLAGERLFFDPAGPGCYRCHQVEGRGAAAGPDLSTIARGSDRQRLLSSILHPSQEMAPMYVPWTIVTNDGQVRTGLLVREGLEGEQFYVAQDAKEFMLLPADIDERRESKESIMPKGLLDALTDDEIRDLFAYLESLR
jgi:putative membrane-bound dehydrogenase-like protein